MSSKDGDLRGVPGPDTDDGMGQFLAQQMWRNIQILADELGGQRYIGFMTTVLDLARRDLKSRVSRAIDGTFSVSKRSPDV